MHIMNDEIINELYKRAGTPEHVVRHMQAVADFQDQLLDKLAAAGLSYDRDLLRCAAPCTMSVGQNTITRKQAPISLNVKVSRRSRIL